MAPLPTRHEAGPPLQVLTAIARATRPGGAFLMIDIKASSKVEENIENPFAPALYRFSTLPCLTVSLGLDGDGLGTVCGRQLATAMLHEAGFADIQINELEDDPSTTTTSVRSRSHLSQMCTAS